MEKEDIPRLMLFFVLLSFLISILILFGPFDALGGFGILLSIAFSWIALASAFIFKSSALLKAGVSILVILEILLMVLFYCVPNNGPYGI